MRWPLKGGAVILKVENILGGCILTSIFVEDGKADGAAVLTLEETNLLADALQNEMDFAKEDHVAATWRPLNFGAVEFLIGASHCLIDDKAAADLASYLKTRRDGAWIYGGDGS